MSNQQEPPAESLTPTQDVPEMYLLSEVRKRKEDREAERLRLQQENTLLKAALQFYAERAYWNPLKTHGYRCPAELDRGDKARAALTEAAHIAKTL